MFSDLKFALRQLGKQPGFTAIALLTLALGIGATTVTFSLVRAVLLRPFPVTEPERLVSLNQTNTARNFSSDMAVCYADFADWRRDNHTFASAALYEDASYTLAGDSGPAEHLDGGVATAEFFTVLGVPPELGRGFLAEEESPAGPRVVVLSHDLWTRLYHSDPAALGRILRVNSEPHTIIGVMPPGFRLPDNAALWTPLRIALTNDLRGAHSYDGVARLKPGITPEQARLDLDVIATRLERDFPATNTNVRTVVRPFVTSMNADYGSIVLTLFGAVACLLLITCVNLAGLLLARGAAREREIAVRCALGAGRGRIVRQLLVESLVLGLAGGGLGLLLASWGTDFLSRLLVDDLPWWMHLTLDRPVLAFAFGVSVLASLAFGLAPAWQLSRLSLNNSLKLGGRAGSAARTRLLRLLVGTELALALVLLTGAGLLVQSFRHLQKVRPGFEAGGVLTFNLNLPASRYPDNSSQLAATQRIVERLEVLPGVTTAAMVTNLPLGGSNWNRAFTLGGRPIPPPGQSSAALNRVISPGYFRAMGMPLKLGRAFSTADTAISPHVAIIDETFVRQFFPNENPLGRRLHYGRSEGPDHPWIEIVGVVGDVRHYDLRNARKGPGLYVPATQNPPGSDMFFVLRTAGDPAALAASARAAVAGLDRELAPAAVHPMTEIVRDAIWRDQLVGGIFTGFAGLALFLSALGVYGVTSFATNQRTREIGVRMALGAQRGDVLRLVVGGGLRLAGLALALGLAVALGLSQLLASQLYDISPRDPVVLGVVTLTLIAVTVLACWLPARRAAKVDPVVALRAE